MCHPTTRFTDVASVTHAYATQLRQGKGRPHHNATSVSGNAGQPNAKPFWGGAPGRHTALSVVTSVAFSQRPRRGRAFLTTPGNQPPLLPFLPGACHHRSESESLYSYGYRG